MSSNDSIYHLSPKESLLHSVNRRIDLSVVGLHLDKYVNISNEQYMKNLLILACGGLQYTTASTVCPHSVVLCVASTGALISAYDTAYLLDSMFRVSRAKGEGTALVRAPQRACAAHAPASAVCRLHACSTTDAMRRGVAPIGSDRQIMPGKKLLSLLVNHPNNTLSYGSVFSPSDRNKLSVSFSYASHLEC